MTKVFPYFKQSVVVLGISLAITGCQPDSAQHAPAPKPRPVAVDALSLKAQPVETTSTLPGRTSAYRVAEVRPQVAGIILQRKFTEGTYVKKDQVLYQIDPATYQAALDSAKANLASAEATLEKAKMQAKRYQNLVKRRAVSEQDYEDARATYREAAAAVLASEAAVKTAQINLDYTEIKAPISGQIGKSFVSEGALVTANQTAYLATIQQLDPLYVDLTQSGTELLKIRAEHTKRGETKLTGIQLNLDDGTPIQQKATLQFADVSVDEGTGTVALRALLPNPGNVLLPGLYVRAQMPNDFIEKGILVPQEAVSRDQRGEAHVMVIGDGNKVVEKTIDVSSMMAGNWVVQHGLKAGDKVIVTGLQKVRPGSEVQPTVTEQQPLGQGSSESTQ